MGINVYTYKEVAPGCYQLYSPVGIEIGHAVRFDEFDEAEKYFNNWASSWSDVRVEFQKKCRDCKKCTCNE